jgi:hypothetical protein
MGTCSRPVWIEFARPPPPRQHDRFGNHVGLGGDMRGRMPAEARPAPPTLMGPHPSGPKAR